MLDLVEAGLMAINVVGFPIAKALFNLAKLVAFPFGKEVVRETELKAEGEVSDLRKGGGIILNIIWLPFGLCLSIAHLIMGIIAFFTNHRYSCGYRQCEIS